MCVLANDALTVLTPQGWMTKPFGMAPQLAAGLLTRADPGCARGCADEDGHRWRHLSREPVSDQPGLGHAAHSRQPHGTYQCLLLTMTQASSIRRTTREKS